MQKSFLSLTFLVLFLSGSFLFLGSTSSPAKMIKAPSWEGVEWINLAPEEDSLNINDLKGQVIYLSFFQKW